MNRPHSLAGVAAMLALATTLLGCGGTGAAVGPAAAPPVVPGEATTPPDLTGVQLPNFVMPQIKGAVSRPNPKLTPGSVVTTDVNVVCAIPVHGGASHTVPLAMQTAVLQEYGHYNLGNQQHKYMLNYLVPIDLGGGTDEANVWPVAIKGAGFYQKVETDHILRDLVCRRTLPLTAAQQAMETDWYAAWLRYVVATGHA
jgi:hypothetical protein